MATPLVNLRRVKRKKSFVYMLDYTINGNLLLPHFFGQ